MPGMFEMVHNPNNVFRGETSGVCVIIMIITREVDGWPFGHKGRPLKGRRKKNKHKRCLLGHSTALVRFSLSSAPDSTT